MPGEQAQVGRLYQVGRLCQVREEQSRRVSLPAAELSVPASPSMVSAQAQGRRAAWVW